MIQPYSPKTRPDKMDVLVEERKKVLSRVFITTPVFPHVTDGDIRY
jgi:hypothetical protein